MVFNNQFMKDQLNKKLPDLFSFPESQDDLCEEDITGMLSRLSDFKNTTLME